MVFQHTIALVGIFTILILSLVGSLTPYFVQKWTNSLSFFHSPLFVFGNGLSGGLILAVAFVHSIPDSFDSFREAVPEDASPTAGYAWPGFFALMGCLVAILAEALVHSRMHSSDHHTSNGDNINMDDPYEPKQGTKEHKHHTKEGGHEFTFTEQLTELLVMFVGFAMHNMFIGIALGLEEDLGLLIAILVHQTFEALAIGTPALAVLNDPKKHWFLFAVDIGFSLICSVGIAIGVGIQEAVASDAYMYNIVNSVFQGLSGGLLVYVSVVHLVAKGQDMTPRSEVITLLGILLGAGIMAVIGIWA